MLTEGGERDGVGGDGGTEAGAGESVVRRGWGRRRQGGSRETVEDSEGRGSGKVEVEEEEAQARDDVEGQTPAESEGRASGEGEGRGSGRGDEGEKREWGIGGRGKPAWGVR